MGARHTRRFNHASLHSKIVTNCLGPGARAPMYVNVYSLQVGSYLGYTGRAANVAAKAAHDHDPTWLNPERPLSHPDLKFYAKVRLRLVKDAAAAIRCSPPVDCMEWNRGNTEGGRCSTFVLSVGCTRHPQRVRDRR
jgi:hypothetical protein